MKKISATALAKTLGIQTKEVFSALLEARYVERVNDAWTLTPSGANAGGELKDSKKGSYIAWPETLNLAINSDSMISSTNLGKHFALSARSINQILSEIGWINKALKGWHLTPQGKKHGGVQDESSKGIPYVRWPFAIVESKILINSIHSLEGTTTGDVFENHSDKPAAAESTDTEPAKQAFREKFEAKFRTTDGHFVRSKAEMIIDNWLYMAEIVHAYERKLPIEEDMYSDFYIPTGKVYIEYWGYENNPRYLERKKVKIALYEKYGFNLIQLVDEDVSNLDDILPGKLLKFGVQAY